MSANATCSICGKPYKICNACLDQKTFKPWRTVTDTIEHYKIYMALHSYTISKNKEQAKQELENCDLTGLDDFNPDIQSSIKEILAEAKNEKEGT
ncbi:MAG: hypothetical protein J6C32_06085 [Eubacterium sp.]|nr:hypothetical protein [Eubacterium sp.]